MVSLLFSEFCAVAQSQLVAPSRTSNTMYLFFLNLNFSMINKSITSPKLVDRMPEILARGGGAIEVLHTHTTLVVHFFILLINRVRKS